MVIPLYGNQRIHLPILEFYMNIYLPLYLLISTSKSEHITALSGAFTKMPPDMICKIVNRAQKNVCCNATYSDIKSLLYRNIVSSEAFQDKLRHTVSQCPNCRVTAKTLPSRKVSLVRQPRIQPSHLRLTLLS